MFLASLKHFPECDHSNRCYPRSKGSATMFSECIHSLDWCSWLMDGRSTSYFFSGLNRTPNQTIVQDVKITQHEIHTKWQLDLDTGSTSLYKTPILSNIFNSLTTWYMAFINLHLINRTQKIQVYTMIFFFLFLKSISERADLLAGSNLVTNVFILCWTKYNVYVKTVKQVLFMRHCFATRLIK